ncbi:MAG: response regulator [Candidatus Aminicenantaceae bacterium]
MDKTIKVLIADDHAIVRRGIKQVLAEIPGVQVTAEAASGAEVLELIDSSEFDLVLLDISMPRQSGIEVLKQIKWQKPDLPVLVLSIYPEEQFAVRALRAGSSGYLTKESAPDELKQAVIKIARGEKYITSSLAEKLASEISLDRKKMPHEILSDREYEVFNLLASGNTASQVAQKMSLSVKTISTYRSRILSKMNFKTNAQLTHYAFKHNLIE